MKDIRKIVAIILCIVMLVPCYILLIIGDTDRSPREYGKKYSNDTQSTTSVHGTTETQGSTETTVTTTAHDDVDEPPVTTTAHDDVVEPHQSTQDVKASGTCGNGVEWTLMKSGVLKIEGSNSNSKTYDYEDGNPSSPSPRPWNDRGVEIYCVEIQNLAYLGSWIFDDLLALESVSLPAGLKELGEGCFSGCLGLKQIQLPSTLQKIGKAAFNCCGLETVVLPASVTSLGDKAFFSSGLKSITLSDQLTSIGAECFAECSRLGMNGTSVFIPASVSAMGKYVFYHCPKLNTIQIDRTQIPSGWNAAWKEGCDATVELLNDDDPSPEPPHTHTEAWKTTQSATCTQDGIRTKYCTACNEVLKTEAIPAIGHHKAGAWTVDSHHGNTMTVSVSCSACGEKLLTLDVKNAATFDPQTGLTFTSIPTPTTPGTLKATDGTASSVSIPWTTFLVASGKLTDNSEWTYTLDGSLTLDGENVIEVYDPTCFNEIDLTGVDDIDYSDIDGDEFDDVAIVVHGRPWEDYESRIYTVKVKNAVCIGNYVFAGLPALTRVELPAGLEEIWDGTFEGCRSLSSITFPNSLEYLGDECFGLTGLTSVTLPSGMVDEIGEAAFVGCKQLKSVDFSKTDLSYLSEGILMYCTALETVVFPPHLQSIESSAFLCSGLRTITIPETVEELGVSVFRYCFELKSVDLSQATGLTFLPEYTFYLCESLGTIEFPWAMTEFGDYSLAMSAVCIVTFPPNVTSLGAGVFAGCESLQSVDFTGSTNLTEIPDYAFLICTSLTTVTLPPQLKTIGEAAFYGCSALQKLTIPADVSEMGALAFDDCISLQKITLQGRGAVPIEWEDALWCGDSTPQIIYEVSYLGGGKCGDNLTWSLSSDGVLRISGTGAMDNQSIPWRSSSLYPSISTVVVEEGVTSIRDNAFSDPYWGNHSNIRVVQLPSTLLSIGDYAFAQCFYLETIRMPENTELLYIGEYAFYNCWRVISFDIPASVTTIGGEAFYDWRSSTILRVHRQGFSDIPSGWDYDWNDECYAQIQFVTGDDD